MAASNVARTHGHLVLAAAVAAGILLTLTYQDVYPRLKRFYGRCRGHSNSQARPIRLGDNDGGHDDHDSLPHTLPTGVESLIGNTPLIVIPSLSRLSGRTILAKCEYLNGAGGSPKDRVALAIIRAGEASGQLRPGRNDTIYEGTVGSTGISLAALARALGYKCHICMPSDQSQEKVDLLHHLGATVERVTPAPIADRAHFVNIARRKAEEHAVKVNDGSRGFFADQFENDANWRAHYEGTGPEIWQQCSGHIDAFVAGAGTGGTMTGVAKYLKERTSPGSAPPARSVDDSQDPPAPCRIVLADPQGSGLYHRIRHGVLFSPTEREGTRRRAQVDSVVEGIGLTRLTGNFARGAALIDDAVRVSDAQAARMAHWLVDADGLFVGSSSAVNCVAALVVAARLPPGSRVVTVLCDSGARHLSKFWRMVGELEKGEVERGAEGDLWGDLGLEEEREALRMS